MLPANRFALIVLCAAFLDRSGGSTGAIDADFLSIHDNRIALRAAYGVGVKLLFTHPGPRSGDDTISGRVVRPADSARAIRAIASAAGMYDPGVVKRTLFKKICICRDLRRGGHNASAISDFFGQLLYFGTDDLESGVDTTARTFHHEFFHMIDAKDDGTFEDEAWARLNPGSFRYGLGDTHGLSWIEEPGFLSGYSKFDAAEDKAELFSRLMTDPRAVLRRSGTDGVIFAKVAFLKTLLGKYDPCFDEGFWRRVERDGSRDRGRSGGNRRIRY